MRPVERGPVRNTYVNYTDAIEDLEAALGRYCSYCERHIVVSLAVEHVSPKSVDPTLQTTWSNFLLSCGNCNSVKGKKETNSDGWLWPDRDNTFFAFQYSAGGFVNVKADLPSPQKEQAKALCDLVGLDRHGATGFPKGAKRDKRWRDREQLFKIATDAKLQLDQADERGRGPIRDLILVIVAGYGFFSVWLTVFAGNEEMVRAILAKFPGTAMDCFDAFGFANPRPGGLC